MNTINHITLDGVTKYIKDSAGQAMLAPEEATITAANAYAAGDLFRYDGKLYKAKAAIAIGDTIVVEGAGANAEETSVESNFAKKYGTVLTGSLSKGRKANTAAPGSSFAFGENVEASGSLSFATGSYTKASASGSSSFGYGTIANLPYMVAIGTANVEASVYPEWVANTSYNVGDRVRYTVIFSETARLTSAFECTNANNDAEFTMANWRNIGALNMRSGDAIFVVGNGTALNNRSNAYALNWDGTGHYMGDVYVGCNTDSSGGTKLAKITDVPTMASIIAAVHDSYPAAEEAEF